MFSSNSSEPDRILDRIVTALRDEPIPDFRDPLAADPPIGAGKMGRTLDSFGSVPVRARRRWLRAVISATALAVVATLVVMSVNGPSGGKNVAFAQVREAVSKTKSLRCRFLDFHGDQDPYVTTIIWSAGVGSRGEGFSGSESITNLKERRSLLIDHHNRTAQIVQLYLERDEESGGDSFVEKIRNLPANGAKELGSAVLNGKKLLKFAFTMTGEFVVFVDPITKLPVRMEMTLEKGLAGGKTFREVVTDFVFDAPVEDSLFEIKAPSGYTVSYCVEPKDRRAVDTRTLVVSPAKGLGPVRLGSPKAQVIAAFGTPDQIEETFRDSRILPSPAEPPVDEQKHAVAERLSYPSLGFEINVLSDEGVTGFECFGRLRKGDLARDFQGKTDAQIGLGASIDDVLKAYGKPDVRTRLREDVFHYFYKGLNFVFSDGKLASFSVAKPLSDRIEIIDHGDGSWSTRVTEKKEP